MVDTTKEQNNHSIKLNKGVRGVSRIEDEFVEFMSTP